MLSILITMVTLMNTFDVSISNEMVCTKDHITEALKSASHCRPLPKVVKLEMPGNGSFTQMTPQHVELNLCGGGCHSTAHSCISTGKTVRHVPVLLSTCGLLSGTCHKTCSFVQLEEDSSCSCGCLHEQMTSCSSRQEFSNSRCKCECLEDKEEKLCLDQGRMWDTDKCECSCPMSRLQPCSTGFVFDHVSTCSCVPEHSTNLSNSVSDARVVRSESNDLLGSLQNVEMIIIVTLGVVVLVFFIFIINLLSSVRNLRTNVRKLKEELNKVRPDIHSEESLLIR